MAFRAFKEAVTTFALAKGLQMTKGPDPKFYDICFGGAPHVEHADQLENVFPHLDLQFKGVSNDLNHIITQDQHHLVLQYIGVWSRRTYPPGRQSFR